MKKTLLLLFLVLSLLRMQGQDLQSQLSLDALRDTSARIGLVLSGGGAKCFSQIGVLQVLEEEGIQPDYIAGTSMGAIVGGLYALGYSADEIEYYMHQVNWEALMTNEVPRNRLSYFDRKSSSRYLVSLPIKNFKVSIPGGINYAQYILKELSYLTQKSYRYERFEDFPIPFLCVGTNLVTGELKIFKEGRLLDALRASSSFPSLFTPHEIDDKLYVDGGVINNYPVIPLMEEAEMDYIIGIDLQNFLYEKDELNSVMQVLEQTSSYINAEQQENMLRYTDLLIEPKMPPKAGLTTFSMIDTLIQIGRNAAQQHLEGIRHLKEQQGESSPPVHENIDATPLRKFYVQDINISPLKNSTRSYVLGKLRIQENDSLSSQWLDRGMDRLYGSQYFKSIDYTLSKADTGYNLNFHIVENENLSKIKLGLHYDQDYKTAVLVNYTTRNFLFRNSRLSADLALGDNSRIKANYFVDRGFIPTIGLKFRANRFSFRTYRNQEPINQRRYVDASTDLFIQSTILDAYALGGGLEFDYVDITDDIDPQGIQGIQETFLNYYAYLDFDSFNDANFPTKGFQLSGMYRIISGRKGLDQQFFEPSSVINVEYNQVYNISGRVTAISRISGISTIGPETEAPYKIYMGSLGENYINYIYPFAGYQYMELIGENALIARLDLNVEFLPNQYVVAIANYAKLESEFDDLFNPSLLLDGYALGYTYDSPVGPLSLKAMGSTNHDEIYTYISLGFWF